MAKKRKIIIQMAVGLAIFMVGILVGRLSLLFIANMSIDTGAMETRQGGFEFINPLLTCDISDSDHPQFDGLKRKLYNLVTQLKSQGKAKRISVYFRDMNPGRFTGVDEDDLYSPASLMKLPILIAYLEESRKDSQIVNEKLKYTLNSNEDQYFKPKVSLKPGEYYTVNDLLSSMIRWSDNNAAGVLLGAISTSTLNDVYSFSGVYPENGVVDNISPVQYMNLFRLLYNAGYLGNTRSRQALELLSETDFDGGISAGVPGHTVSHKFGERTIGSVDSTGQRVFKRELHDCGIVYYPGNPYALCVMTEGNDFTSLEYSIASISRMVYNEVDNGLLREKN